MKQFRDALDHIKGLRYLFEEMDFSSSIGRLTLLESEWMSDIAAINRELDEVAKYIDTLSHTKGMSLVERQLEEVVNIRGSIEGLRQIGAVCSDVDLFEIKKLALIDEKIRTIEEEYKYQLTPRPALSGVLTVLDPKEERLPSFYLDDDFDPKLRELRQSIERTTEDAELTNLNKELTSLEDQVRRRLSSALSPYADDLDRVLAALSRDTVLIAKARWAIKARACRPVPTNSGTNVIEEMIHPEVARQLSDRGGEYQPVSIRFDDEPTLISGANMGGKSVLLHTVGLTQALMQFGMYVPAKSATLTVVDEILYSAGDGEDMLLGLSSFGAEMLRLNQIIKAAKEGQSLLAVIDEPARTTNPEEGYALVSGLVKLLERYRVKALITTHYSGIVSQGKRWRVKGFTGGEQINNCDGIKVSDLGQLMDYRLVPDTHDSVPREAFRMARLLGVDTEFLDLSNQSFRSIRYEK